MINGERFFTRLKALLIVIQKALYSELTKGKIRTLGIYFVGTAFMELMAYLYQGIFSVIASRIWVLGGLACGASILSSFLCTVIYDIKERKLLSIGLLVILLLFLSSIIGNLYYTEISPDATQQVAAGLASYHIGDLSYTGKAFLGYPARQYVIAALPAFLFGRSLASLQWGFALPFFMGLLSFYCGLRKWAEKLNISTQVCVLPLYALFVFPFVSEYFTIFEQAIYPISFTMLVTGFFLLLLCKPNIVNFIGLAWSGCMLSNSYTPALATLGLLLVFTILTAITLLTRPKLMPFTVKTPQLTAKALFFLAVNSFIYFLATLIDKRQDRFTQIRTDVEIVKQSINNICDFLTDKNAAFLGMFGIVVIVYLLSGLSLRLKLRDCLIAMWTLAVFAITYLMRGYCSYDEAFIMQRAMVVLPVIVMGVTLTIYDMLRTRKRRINPWRVSIIAISFSLIGLFNFRQINQSFIYFNYIQPMKYMLEDLEATVRESKLDANSEFNFILYTDNPLIKNPEDYCTFLYPHCNVYTPDFGVIPEDLNRSLNTFVYGDSELQQTVETIDSFEITDERYEMDFTWYKGRIIEN